MPNTQVELKTLSQDVFDQLLGEDVPDSATSAKDIVGSSKQEEIKPEKTETNTEPNKEEDKDPKKEKPFEFSKGLDALLAEQEKDGKASGKEPSNQEPSDSSESYQDIDTSEFFRAQAKGLVERGLWEEFEELDDENFEWTEENYGKLIEAQAKWKAEELYNSSIEASGPYGKAIFDYIQKGGDPNDLISIFQEMKEINEVDTTTEDGKLEYLKRYYVDELGWPESKFKRDSSNWIDNEVLDEEVGIVKEKLNASLAAKAERKRQEAEAYKKQQEEVQQNFANNINSALSQREDITEKERREILSDILTYNQKLPDGRVVNKVTLDFMKLQADPQSYIDFVRFVRNPKKYNSSKEKEGESRANKKTWNLIKGNGSIDKKGSGSIPKRNTPEYKGTKIDYKSFLNS